MLTPDSLPRNSSRRRLRRCEKVDPCVHTDLQGRILWTSMIDNRTKATCGQARKAGLGVAICDTS